MRGLTSALRTMLILPPVWLALLALLAAVATNDPVVDVLRYAAQRLIGFPG